MRSQILPDLRVVQYDYDANGNVTFITPPGRPAHGFEYTAVDLQETYEPLPVLGSGDEHDLHVQLRPPARPDHPARWPGINPQYDMVKRRLTTRATPTRLFTYEYGDDTERSTASSADSRTVGLMTTRSASPRRPSRRSMTVHSSLDGEGPKDPILFGYWYDGGFRPRRRGAARLSDGSAAPTTTTTA